MHTCPRREGTEFSAYDKEDADDYRDGHCTHCGSLDPGVFMSRLEAADVRLGPTDKNYKVYVANDGGAPFVRRYRTDFKPYQGWESPEHDWATENIETTKFYFMHLSEEQKRRFVELLNEKKLKLGEPGHFYRLPYFIELLPRE